MKKQLDELLSRVLIRWVDAVRRHAHGTSIGVLLATAAALTYTLANLGINSDNMSLISDQLPGM